MFCRHCGMKLEDGVKFCMYCGAPVDVVPAAPAAAAPEPEVVPTAAPEPAAAEPEPVPAPESASASEPVPAPEPMPAPEPATIPVAPAPVEPEPVAEPAPAPRETPASGAPTELLGAYGQQPGAYGQQPTSAPAPEFAPAPEAAERQATPSTPDAAVRKHRKGGHKRVIVAVVAVAVIAVLAVVGVLFVAPAVSGGNQGKGADAAAGAAAGADDFEGSIYLDATLKANNDKTTLSHTLFGVSGNGNELTFYRSGARVTGTVESSEKVDGGTKYTLKDVSGDSYISSWGLKDMTATVVVPDGATKDKPYGTWISVLKGTDSKGAPQVRSDALSISEDGKGKLTSTYAKGAEKADASSLDWADPTADGYDVSGDAAKKAVKAKSATISAREFSWKDADGSRSVTWTGDGKSFSSYEKVAVRTYGDDWSD